MSLDWITDLPPNHYHDAILVVVDRLTKQAIFIATTKSMSAPEVASLFIQHVIRVHGLPDSLVSDFDPVFTSHFWRRLLELLGIRANRSSAFHHLTGGRTERMNSVLEQYLRMHYDFQQTDWASLLPMAESFLQQLSALNHYSEPVLRELRVPSPHIPAPSLP